MSDAEPVETVVVQATRLAPYWALAALGIIVIVAVRIYKRK
jgi:hypothetical protein